MIEALKRLGLSETESNIYLQLIKKGELTAIEIAKEIKTHRRTIYDNLNILINKGLVTYFIEKEVKYFQAANPEIFKKLQEEKDHELNKILPELNSYFLSKKRNPNVSIIKGLDSSKSIILEMMRFKREIYWMGGGFQILNSLGYSKENLLSELSKLKLKVIQPVPENDNYKKYFKNIKLKLIPKKYQSNISFFVYGNTIIIGSLLNDDIFGIKIENPEMAKAYKNYFELIWVSN
jgi:sugar-specific transcriptional regulator TrmB